MISLDQALAIVLENSFSTGSEKVNFQEALGRVLAQDVVSDMEMPPFDKTAVDGFACRIEDLEKELEVIEVIPAGKAPEKTIQEGTCAKIMTGAKIPEGANYVVMVEHTEELSSGKIKFTGKKGKNNICLQGEDVKVGGLVIEKSSLIKAQHLAVMASVGCVQPEVAKRPKVAILSTGDELVEPEFTPGMSQIRNSNGHQLIGQVVACGAEANYMGIVEDTEEATRKAIQKALDENDLVLLTGGVSMGDFDFVPKIMKECGVDIKFDKIAVQPGKPTTFGVHSKALIFGLPGNPVSSFMQFELLVRPLLFKMMGGNNKVPAIHLPMATEYKRKRTERLAFIPVSITDEGKAAPVEYHGSAHIYALHKADGIISIPIGLDCIKEGEIVHVRQI